MLIPEEAGRFCVGEVEGHGLIIDGTERIHQKLRIERNQQIVSASIRKNPLPSAEAFDPECQEQSAYDRSL